MNKFLTVLLASSLLTTSAFASCLEKYDAELTELETKIEQTAKKQNKNDKYLMSVAFGAPASGASIGAPYLMVGGMASGATTGFVGGLVVGILLVKHWDSKIKPEDRASTYVKAHDEVLAAGKFIKEGHAGNGVMIQKIMPQIIKDTNNTKISVADVAKTIVALDEAQSFCSQEDRLDTADAILGKVIESLK